MSLTKNAIAAQEFLYACFNRESSWNIREVAVSDLGWSLKIDHSYEEWCWSVQGDAETILFTLEERKFSLWADNPPTGILAALQAVQSLAPLSRWSWLKNLEEEITEV